MSLQTKIISISFLLLISIQRISAQNETHHFDSPATYNNLIVLQHNQVTQKNLLYISQSVHSQDIAAIEKSRQAVVTQIEQSINKLEAIGGYEGDTKLRDVAVKVLQLNLETFDLDFKEINEMRSGRYDSYETLEAYFRAEDKAEKKLAKAADQFRTAQQDFADTHGLDLKYNQDDERQQVIKVVNKLNTYNRIIFLSYFGVSKLDSYFWEQLKAKEYTQADKQRQELANTATEAVTRLKRLSGFKDDTQYRDATLQLVQRYQSLSLNEYKELLTIQSKLDDPGEVTSQEQADALNKMGDRYNQIVETYNQEMQVLINDMNTQQQQLMQSNVPKLASDTGIIRT